MSCLNCKDRVSHINETIAKCNACDSMVKISECASYQTARVIFRASGSKQQHKITFFSKDIKLVTTGISGTSLFEIPHRLQ